MMDYDAFCDIARRVNRSSPGPDGILYHARLVGKGVPLRVLHCAYVALASGAAPASLFKDALLVFIPKRGPALGVDGYAVAAVKSSAQ